MKLKKILVIFLAALLIFQFTACEGGKSSDSNKIQIVFEFQDGHINAGFESAIEEKFDVDLVMNMNQSTNPYLRLEQELTHDMAPDIVLCEYIRSLDDDIKAEYFYDMRKESFVNNYYKNAIESCTTEDGGLYYIPGPVYVYGIVYDKTAFKELNLEVPESYSEFVELINTVDSMNLTGKEPDPNDTTKTIDVPVRAFVPTMRWCDMFQIIFNTMNYEDSIRSVNNAKWLADYQNGDASMVGHMESAAEKYIKLFDDGILSTDMWTVEPGYRSARLYYYHTSLMTIECQQGYEFNKSLNEENPDNMHEMGMMPIYTSDDSESDYLYGIPRSFISITNQGAEDPEKLEKMLEIMDYLSTAEGQKLLINGSDYFGFLKEGTSFDSDFYSEVVDTIAEGRIITNFYYGGDGNGDPVESYMHETTPDLLSGTLSIRQWLEGSDAVRDKALSPESNEVYGTVEETLVPLQTAYVDGLAYLASMDADIGYVPVSLNYGTESYFFSGDIDDDIIYLISTENVYMVNPKDSDMKYVVAEVTGKDLMDYAVHSANDGMAAFAGVEMTYSMSGRDGSQYVSMKINGKDMDMNKTYRVASLKGALPKNVKVIKSYPDLTFSDIFRNYLRSQDGIVTAPESLKIVD